MRPLTLGVLVSSNASVGPTPPSLAGADPGLEHEGDLRSASDLCAALRRLGHEAVPLAADGQALDEALARLEVDACLLALHGSLGGSGAIQSMLTREGIPFAGPDASTTARAFDKRRAYERLAHHNLAVPPYVLLSPGRPVSDRELERLGWPCVVKPRRGSGGAGVSWPERVGDLSPAIRSAIAVDREVLLQRAIAAREIQVVLLGDRVLGSCEVSRTQVDGAAALEIVCPPAVSRARLLGIHELARRAVEALELHEGLSRVDILLDARRNEFVIEVEPLPSLARTSVVARVAAAAGCTYEALVADLLDRIVLRSAPRLVSHAHVELQ